MYLGVKVVKFVFSFYFLKLWLCLVDMAICDGSVPPEASRLYYAPCWCVAQWQLVIGYISIT